MSISFDFDELEKEYTITISNTGKLIAAFISRYYKEATTKAELYVIENYPELLQPVIEEDGFIIY